MAKKKSLSKKKNVAKVNCPGKDRYYTSSLKVIGPEFLIRCAGTCQCIGGISNPELQGAKDGLWFMASVDPPGDVKRVDLYLEVSVGGKVVELSAHSVSAGDATKWHNW